MPLQLLLLLPPGLHRCPQSPGSSRAFDSTLAQAAVRCCSAPPPDSSCPGPSPLPGPHSPGSFSASGSILPCAVLAAVAAAASQPRRLEGVRQHPAQQPHVQRRLHQAAERLLHLSPRVPRAPPGPAANLEMGAVGGGVGCHRLGSPSKARSWRPSIKKPALGACASARGLKSLGRITLELHGFLLVVRPYGAKGTAKLNTSLPHPALPQCQQPNTSTP